MARRVRIDDPFRDATGGTSHDPTDIDILTLPAGTVAVTDPNPVVDTLTYTVAAKGATVDLAATNAAVFEDDLANVTAVRYTPVSDISAASAGNSRTWALTLANGSTNVATLTIDENSSTVSHVTGILFTLQGAATGVTNQTLKVKSTHGGAGGLADPGGVVTITRSF